MPAPTSSRFRSRRSKARGLALALGATFTLGAVVGASASQPDKGGHRERATQLVDQAIAATRAGINFAR